LTCFSKAVGILTALVLPVIHAGLNKTSGGAGFGFGFAMFLLID
jgi:hypothetical protein